MTARKVDLSWSTPKAVNFLQSQAKLSLFIGGVRSSKTFTGSVKGCLIALQTPNSLGLVIAPTYSMVRDVLVKTYIDILTLFFGLQQGTDFTYHKSNHHLHIHGGGDVLFRSGENPERLEGITADWYHLDEAAQMSEKVYKICLDRTTRPLTLPRGYGWITTTPKGQNWVYRLYSEAATEAEYYAETILTSEAGIVKQAEIEHAKKALDPRYFRQQYLATFEAWAGLVYDDFTRAENVRPLKYNPELINYIGMDMGWNDETAVLWYQHDRTNGIWYLLSEFVESYIRPETLAKVIRGEEVVLSGQRKFKAPYSLEQVERIYPGTDISNRQQAADGLSLRDILVANGIDKAYFRVKQHRVFDSILSVRAKVKGADGVCRLFVDPSCKRYIGDKESWHYPEKDGVITGEMPDASNDNHRFSHTNDAERYVIDSVEPTAGSQIFGGLT